MLSMSIVVVMGTSEIKNTSINFTFDESTKTEFWASKVIGFSSQYSSTRYKSHINVNICLVMCHAIYKGGQLSR